MVSTAGRLWVKGGTAPPAAVKRAALSRKPPSTLDALTREGKIGRQGPAHPAVSHVSSIGNISTPNTSSPAGAPAARAAGAEEAAGAEATGAKAAGAIGPGWSM